MKRSFTLLEIMIALSLILMAAGAVAWKMKGAIAKNRFHSDVSRIQVQLESSYRLAINTKADWTVILDRSADRLNVSSLCATKLALIPFQPRNLPLQPLKMIFNGREAERFVIYFSPTGKVSPEGVLELLQPSNGFHKELRIPELFQRREVSEKEGPLHPDDAS